MAASLDQRLASGGEMKVSAVSATRRSGHFEQPVSGEDADHPAD